MSVAIAWILGHPRADCAIFCRVGPLGGATVVADAIACRNRRAVDRCGNELSEFASHGRRHAFVDQCHAAIYFAKPVTPLTYLCGKWAVAAAFIALVTVVPNLLTLGLGTMVAGGLHTWGQTLDLAMGVALSGVTLCMVGGAIILALSSLSSDHRYVTVAWLAVCLLPMTAQTIVNDLLPPESTTGWLGCLSLRDNVVTLTDWLFGVREAIEAARLPTEAFTRALVKPVSVPRATIVLAAWTVGGLLVSYRRVVSFSRSAANV